MPRVRYMLAVYDGLEAMRECVFGVPPQQSGVGGKYLQTFLCFFLSLTQVLGPYVSIMVSLPWCIGHMLLTTEVQSTTIPTAGASVLTQLSNWTLTSWQQQCIESVLILCCLYYGTLAIRARLLKDVLEGELPIMAWILDLALILGVTKFGTSCAHSQHRTRR